MRKTSILILNYKTWDKTLEEIKLIIKILKFNPQDIIVVDNNSDNDSLEMLSKESQRLNYILIKSNKNGGYASGNNIGLKYSYNHGYKYCLIINNDILFDDPQLLEKLKETFGKDESIACVNPDIYSPEGKLYNRDSVRPSFIDLTIGILNYRKNGRRVDDKGGYGIVYRPQGCCMLVDLEKMKAVNYFDEHTFLYCEEPILAERLIDKGYKCACSFECQVIHDHSITIMSSANLKKYIEIVTNSFEYYLDKYRNFNKIQIMICSFFNKAKTYLIYKKNMKTLKTKKNRLKA